MKKLIVILLVLSLLLCGCAGGQDYDPKLLEYPGLHWGMGFEEVQKVLGFTDGDIVEKKLDQLNPERPEVPAWHRYTLENVQIFGFPTAQVELRFHEYTGHGLGLAEMVVYFPDGHGGTEATDLDALYDVLREHYGEWAEVIPSVVWNHHSGELEQNEYISDSDNRGWISETTGRDHLSEAELKQLYDIMAAGRTSSDGTLKHPSFEQFCQSQENPAVKLWLEIERDEEVLSMRHKYGATGLRLSFDAELLVNFRAIDRFFMES